MDKNFFKKRIKALRKLNNLTQAQIADVLGLSLSAYADLEEDETTEPTAEIITKLSKIYLVAVSDLIGTEEIEESNSESCCSNGDISDEFNIFYTSNQVLSSNVITLHDSSDGAFGKALELDEGDSMKNDEIFTFEYLSDPNHLRDLQASEQNIVIRFRLLSPQNKKAVFSYMNGLLEKQDKNSDFKLN